MGVFTVPPKPAGEDVESHDSVGIKLKSEEKGVTSTAKH
jgi:hypothetical protein